MDDETSVLRANLSNKIEGLEKDPIPLPYTVEITRLRRSPRRLRDCAIKYNFFDRLILTNKA